MKNITQKILLVLSVVALIAVLCCCSDGDNGSALQMSAEIPKADSSQSADDNVNIMVTTPDAQDYYCYGAQADCPRNNCQNECQGNCYGKGNCGNYGFAKGNCNNSGKGNCLCN